MRGIGRTTNLIDTLPNERCIVVVPSQELVRILKDRIKEDRGENFLLNVKVICVKSKDDIYKLYGFSSHVFFDHSFFELVEEEVVKQVMPIAHNCSIVRNAKEERK